MLKWHAKMQRLAWSLDRLSNQRAKISVAILHYLSLRQVRDCKQGFEWMGCKISMTSLRVWQIVNPAMLFSQVCTYYVRLLAFEMHNP